MIISGHIQEYLQYLEVTKNKSSKTLENYSHYLKRFQDFLKAENTPSDISLKDIQAYRLHLNRFKDGRGKSLNIKTQNYHIIAVRAFLKYLIKNDIETLAPEKIELSKTPQRSVEFLTREELDRLFAAVDRPSRRHNFANPILNWASS